MGGAQAALDHGIVMAKRLRITGTVLRARSAEEKARATRLFAAHVLPLLARGAVRPLVDRVFAAEDAVAAFDYLDRPGKFGKVLLEF
jgi:NADPH:quinone reductase-like Zn-dependent oxidoreductase